MSVVNRLPSKPLTPPERNRIRAHEEVKGLIVIGTTSIHNRRDEQTDSATNMVVLIEETVYALEYEDFEWSVEILQRNADRQDYLARALDQLDNR